MEEKIKKKIGDCEVEGFVKETDDGLKFKVKLKGDCEKFASQLN